MVFYVVRIIVCTPIYYLINKLTNRLRQNYNRNRVISIVLSTIVCIALFFIPIENAFFTFPSYESAYSYNHTSPIETIVNGTETDMVIGKRDMAILPKRDNGWKLCIGTRIKRVASIVQGDTVVIIFRYQDSSDCYVSVYNSFGKSLVVSDTRQSTFYEIEEYKPRLNESNYTYYTCIQSFNDDYSLIVDGQIIPFSEMLIR